MLDTILVLLLEFIKEFNAEANVDEDVNVGIDEPEDDTTGIVEIWEVFKGDTLLWLWIWLWF